jgi:glycine dehydrogenase subunit 1
MPHTSFIPHIEEEQQEMLKAIGVSSIDELFADVPAELKHGRADIPAGASEMEVLQAVRRMAEKNRNDLVCFLGGGFYDHYSPAAVDAIISRGEFATCYTPYQPEVAQGTLQTAFEFQSGICRLTGMDVANASLYEGGTAIYEAMMMAARVTRRSVFIVDQGVNPIYRKMLYSYAANLDMRFHEISTSTGVLDRQALADALDDSVAGVIVQNPNFFGCIDDFSDITAAAHAVGALMIQSAYPLSLGILKTPGEMGADIVVGEGQSLGLPLSFGGPYVGFMATRQKLVRKMPGRICGMTHDGQDRRGFVLTLQAREQHIRREKATSNICTNQNLCAVAATAYMALMGKEGLREVAELSADNASYAYLKLTAIPGVKRTFKAYFFNEFCITLPRDASDVISDLIERGFAAGFPMSRYYPDMDNVLLVAVTEKRTKEEIDRLAAVLESVL